MPAAAIAIDERRIVADPLHASRPIGQHLRARAGAVEAHEHMPALADRIRAALRGERLVPHPIKV